MMHHVQSAVGPSEFHSSGPDTEKLLLPYLIASLIRETARSPCVAERR